MATETVVDNVSRRRFDNVADYEAHYGAAGAVTAEMDLPRTESARQPPGALRARRATPASLTEAA